MKKILNENGMEFVLKEIELPAHNIYGLEKEIEKGSIDIPCRIYLEKPPCNEHELVARETDKENYNPTCFYIEALVGRDGINEPWQTSNWFLFYVNNSGDSQLIDDSIELLEAWDYFKTEYESIKTNSTLENKILIAKKRQISVVGKEINNPEKNR